MLNSQISWMLSIFFSHIGHSDSGKSERYREYSWYNIQGTLFNASFAALKSVVNIVLNYSKSCKYLSLFT